MGYKDIEEIVREDYWDVDDFGIIHTPKCGIRGCENDADYVTQYDGMGANLCEKHYFEFENAKG